MSQPCAWVVTIGDELMRGEIVDSNKSLFSERLLRLDIETVRHVTVADDPDAMAEVLREAAARARIVLVSGGLGPTRDDLTTEVVARTFGRGLYRDEAVLERMQAFFRSLGREMTPNNAKQADFPEGAEILPNPLGTAPGFLLQVERAGGERSQGSLIFCTPGVPRELYRMVDEEILPRIEARLERPGFVRAALLRTFGLGESVLDSELTDIARDNAAVTLGFRTQFPDNLVRVVARGSDRSEAERELRRVVDAIRARLGPLVVGEGERGLEEIVGELLLEGKRTVAVAESCTGGLLASRLTDVPGSSAYLLEAAVVYSNQAKQRVLGVEPAALDAHGAVSEAVVRQMAEGMRRKSGADFALATTGIAGPGGGSEDKPVGTLWVALAGDGKRLGARSEPQASVVGRTQARRYQLMRDRARNKLLASQIGLEWLRRTLLGLELPDETFPRQRGGPR